MVGEERMGQLRKEENVSQNKSNINDWLPRQGRSELECFWWKVRVEKDAENRRRWKLMNPCDDPKVNTLKKKIKKRIM